MDNPQPPTWQTVIIVDGAVPRRGWAALVAQGAVVVAVDGGARYALAEGVAPTVCVGDFDSLESGQLERCRASGAEVIRHPVAKDDTDFALAVSLVEERDLRRANGDGLLVVGGSGGRLDHEIGNLIVLAGATAAGWEVTALMGESSVAVAGPDRAVRLVGSPGDAVSLVPVGGPAGGVTTRGLAWALAGADLGWNSIRGVSNVIDSVPASVEVHSGRLLVIEPAGVAALLSAKEREAR